MLAQWDCDKSVVAKSIQLLTSAQKTPQQNNQDIILHSSNLSDNNKGEGMNTTHKDFMLIISFA